MSQPQDDFCSRALPYIKAAVRGTFGPAITLSFEDSFVLKDLGNGLLVLYLVDTGDAFEYAQNRHLKDGGIDPGTLHATAMANLARLASGKGRVMPHGGIFALSLEGNFEASLLLLDYLWDTALAGHALNGFVAAVPARDMLAFCDARSAQGVRELREMIDRVWSGGDHLISSHLFRREGGGWVSVQPAARAREAQR